VLMSEFDKWERCSRWPK